MCFDLFRNTRGLCDVFVFFSVYRSSRLIAAGGTTSGGACKERFFYTKFFVVMVKQSLLPFRTKKKAKTNKVLMRSR